MILHVINLSILLEYILKISFLERFYFCIIKSLHNFFISVYNTTNKLISYFYMHTENIMRSFNVHVRALLRVRKLFACVSVCMFSIGPLFIGSLTLLQRKHIVASRRDGAFEGILRKSRCTVYFYDYRTPSALPHYKYTFAKGEPVNKPANKESFSTEWNVTNHSFARCIFLIPASLYRLHLQLIITATIITRTESSVLFML